MAAETCAYVLGVLAARAALSAAIRRFAPPRLAAAIPNLLDAAGSVAFGARIAYLFLVVPSSVSDYIGYATDAPRVPAFDSHMRLETAWYVATGLFVKAEDASMLLHHVLAVALVQLSLAHNVTRLGMALLPYLVASNPLLHAARALRKAGFHRACRVAFVAFVAVFTAGRVIAFPAFYIRPVLTNGAAYWLLDEPLDERRAAMYYTGAAMLCALYLLQVVWFVRIARILRTV